jgi:rod shape-determining protein MreC
VISISWQKLKPVRDVGVLLVGLFVPFLVLRTHIRDPKEWGPLDQAIVKLSEPVQEGAAWLARGISNLWGDYVYLVDVKADNKRLVFENARLEERVRRLEAQESENRRLRRLLGLRESMPGDVVSAQVIGKDVSEFFRVVRLSLDRGGRDVKKEMPVVGLGGVVGIVQRVAGDTVDVKLVADPESAVDVVVERTGTRGIVRGTGDLTKYALRVEYTQRTDEVDVGDLLVTSGVGRRFPRGLPVARVTRVIKRDFGIYQEVEAEPTVDFSRLEEALVLISPTSDQPVQPPGAKPVR